MHPADTLPRLYPMFAALRGRAVLVVGAGAVAARKIAALLEAGALVQLVADELGTQAATWVAEQRVRWVARRFLPEQLDAVWLAVVATDDAALNRTVADAAEARRLFVNVVDESELCSFQVPAVLDRAPLQVAVSSGGAAPVLARQVRARIEQVLDEHLGPLALLLHTHRQLIRRALPELGPRRRFLESIQDGPIARAVAARDLARAERLLRRALDSAPSRLPGFVSLVGAGPGDPGLITLKAQRRLQEADVILHDRLVPSAVLALARRDADLIETGKQAGNHHTSQQEIHRLMREHALAGRRVVRLKGGDPFVFGRGGEELEFLRAEGIEYEVIPGITAALACAAHAGIPLTHREHAQSVRLVTAHCQASLDTLDWGALAQERQTLAVYMGVSGLDQLSTRLIAQGRSPDTPCALIENGSRPEQRVVLGKLAALPATAEAFKVRSPALLIIGEVAALARRLHWFGGAPLEGADSAFETTPLLQHEGMAAAA